jgi:hypothetical protein
MQEKESPLFNAGFISYPTLLSPSSVGHHFGEVVQFTEPRKEFHLRGYAGFPFSHKKNERKK